MGYSIEISLRKLADAVQKPDEAACAAAAARQESLAKPPRSLGRLEELSIQLAGITGQVYNRIERKRIIILAADNGVVCEGVASAPQSVTLAQSINFTKRLTGVGVLAKHFNVELQVVDIGINAQVHCPDILNRKIAYGTKNIASEPAMSREQALRAFMTGTELARQAKDDGVDIIGVGEMGIGNTTTSAAVLCALTGLTAEQAVGKGGGITEESYLRKKAIVSHALENFVPDQSDPVDVLAKVGGFDLAAMAGVFLGAASCRLPVVVDGYISIVAALAAVRYCPNVRYYLISSHASYEKGYIYAAQELGLKPMLLLDMRLGEGSGCPLAFEIVSAACAVIRDMATFQQAEINDDYLEEIRKGDKFTA